MTNDRADSGSRRKELVVVTAEDFSSELLSQYAQRGRTRMAAEWARVLAFNAGSSSPKFELFAMRPFWRSLARGAIRGTGRQNAGLQVGDGPEQAVTAPDAALAAALVLDRLRANGLLGDGVGDRVACGHRVVHGGAEFSKPTRMTTAVRERLAAIGELAPLHNGPALEVVDVVGATLPAAPNVAVFVTAFFHDLPEVARHYAVPGDWGRPTSCAVLVSTASRMRISRAGSRSVADGRTAAC